MKKNRHHEEETAGLHVVLDYKATKRNAVKLEVEKQIRQVIVLFPEKLHL